MSTVKPVGFARNLLELRWVDGCPPPLGLSPQSGDLGAVLESVAEAEPRLAALRSGDILKKISLPDDGPQDATKMLFSDILRGVMAGTASETKPLVCVFGPPTQPWSPNAFAMAMPVTAAALAAGSSFRSKLYTLKYYSSHPPTPSPVIHDLSTHQMLQLSSSHTKSRYP